MVEDEVVFSKLAVTTLEKNPDYDVSVFKNGTDCLKNIHLNPDLVLIDFGLPDISGLELLQKIKQYNVDIKCLIVSAQTDLEVVIKAYRAGASDYLIKNENCMPELENSVKNLSANVILKKQVEVLKAQIIDRSKYEKILGNSQAILKVLKLIQKAERSNILVLTTGESGTGKELVARAIHYNSDRKSKPFVPVNMSAIPGDLIESELFGHEKGSFTGAIAKRIGKFEEAHKGTLFLDEIGDMDHSLQSKLLRILEDKKVVKIGSNKPFDLDIRIIAATNQNLEEKVRDGSFREDLYYRLNGFLIDLPPLKDRDDDVLILAKHFLVEFAKDNNLGKLTLEKSASDALLSYKWPGNARELKSVIERAALITESNSIDAETLNIKMGPAALNRDEEDLTMEEYKLKIIYASLKKHGNDIDVVAEKLKLSRATIYRMLKKYQFKDFFMIKE